MNRVQSSDIDEALQVPREDVQALAIAATQSKEFQIEVAAALCLLARGECPAQIISAAMIVMLSVGMKVERRRQEISLLELLYEGGQA